MNQSKETWNFIRDEIDRVTKIPYAVDNMTKTINIGDLTAKEHELKNLLSCRKNMVATIGDIDKKIEILQEQCIIDDVQLVATMKKAGVICKPKRERRITPKYVPALPPTSSSSSHTVNYGDMTNIPVTKNMSLSAIIVATEKDVGQNGLLHYVTTKECFAIYIAANLLMGNIGKIYISGGNQNQNQNPTKIRACRFGDKCVKVGGKCEYYHGPPDVRNYSAVSWMYSQTIGGARRFGSLDNLDNDIILINQEDVQKYQDQIMHDLLCGLLLKKYHQHKR